MRTVTISRLVLACAGIGLVGYCLHLLDATRLVAALVIIGCSLSAVIWMER